MNGFEDILYRKYPDPEIEKDFPGDILRAAQFAPFAALTGYEDAVTETARLTDRRLEIDEYTMEELNRKLGYILENTETLPETSVTYFVADSKKEGGKYITKKGYIKKIYKHERELVFEDNTIVSIEDIIMIDNPAFSQLK